MNKEKNNLYKLLFISVLMYIVLCNLSKLNQIYVIDDEFGYWGVGAYFAGYDWTGLTPTSPYYGYGLGFIYMIFFKVFKDATIMYKAAIVLNALLLVCAYLLSIRCIKRIYNNIDEKYIILYCSIAALYPNLIVQSQVGWTECLLYFWFWLCVYIVIEIWNNPNIIKCVFFAVILSYGYMVHQRTLGVIISGILIIALGIVLKKLNIKQGIIFFAIILLCFSVGHEIKLNLQENFWLTLDQDVAGMNNISGQVGKIQYIFSLQGIKDLCIGIIGKIIYLITSTYGLILVVIPILFKNVIYIIKKSCVEKRLWKLKIKEISFLFLMLAFCSTFAISVIFMIFYDTRLDIVVYGRYIEFTIGPLLIIGFLEAREYITEKKYVFIGAICIFAIMSILGYAIRENVFSAFHGMNAVGIAEYFSRLNLASYAFYKIAIILFIIIVLIYILEKLQKKWNSLLRLGVYLIIIFTIWNSAIEYNWKAIYDAQSSYAKNTQDVAEAIRENEKNSIIQYVTAESVDGLEKDELYDRNIKYIQFYLYDKKIEVSGVSKIKDNCLYIIRKDSLAFKEMRMKKQIVYENDMYAVLE